MNFKELTLTSFAAALVLSTGCVVDDDPAGDTDDTDNPTTMTVTETMTGPTTTPTTTGPTTTGPTTDTDPDTTDTDPTGDTDTDTGETDTDDIDPDLYEFREDEPGAYTQVDRQGFPAVNTALISTANQDAYNAASPTNDAAGDFLGDVGGAITFLHTGAGTPGDGLGDELRFALGALNPDATPPQIEDLICNPPGDIDPNDTCVAQGGPFVFPDVILLNTGMSSGFPNGRALEVPVVDIILAVLLLDVLDGGKAFNFDNLQAFVDLDDKTEGQQGLSQSGNDLDFSADFPYLAPAHK